MGCPACGADEVAVPLAADLRELLPGDRPGIALCTHCLHTRPVDDPPGEIPDLTAVSAAFPPDRETAAALAVAVALVDSLALNRAELDAVLDRIERDGVDPLLAFDRLAGDPDLDPHMNLARRRGQLEQLL